MVQNVAERHTGPLQQCGRRIDTCKVSTKSTTRPLIVGLSDLNFYSTNIDRIIHSSRISNTQETTRILTNASRNQRLNSDFSAHFRSNTKNSLMSIGRQTCRTSVIGKSEGSTIKETMHLSHECRQNLSNNNLQLVRLQDKIKYRNFAGSLSNIPFSYLHFIPSFKTPFTILLWSILFLLALSSLGFRGVGGERSPLSTHRSGGGVGSAGPCPVSEHTCDNLQCVPRDKVCNGWDDCGDNSDEHAGCSRK